MDNIKDLIRRVVKDLADHKTTRSHALEEILQKVFDKNEKKHIKLVGLKDGKASFSVDSPAWLYQMQTRKNKILEKIKSELPEINSIYFRIGNIS